MFANLDSALYSPASPMAVNNAVCHDDSVGNLTKVKVRTTAKGLNMLVAFLRCRISAICQTAKKKRGQYLNI